MRTKNEMTSCIIITFCIVFCAYQKVKGNWCEKGDGRGKKAAHWANDPGELHIADHFSYARHRTCRIITSNLQSARALGGTQNVPGG